MAELEMRSYAKVNLTLDVLEKRPEDGYHYIRTVMVPIDLHDKVYLRTATSISITTSPEIPGTSEQNLAYRAAMALKERTGCNYGANIEIQKAIPVAGGLAGGSTNAAAVLKGLNKLWRTQLTDQELINVAIGLGSDVPFFIPGRPALAEGIGELVTPVSLGQALWLVLAMPDVVKSTGNVYRLFDELTEVRRPDTDAMLGALAGGDPGVVAASLGNVFEQVMLPRHPEIAAVKQAMMEHGALGALMSGAGPTVFGIVTSQTEALKLQEAIRPLAPRTFVVRTVMPQEG